MRGQCRVGGLVVSEILSGETNMYKEKCFLDLLRAGGPEIDGMWVRLCIR